VHRAALLPALLVIKMDRRQHLLGISLVTKARYRGQANDVIDVINGADDAELLCIDLAC
jgi:hypothetical protein